MLAGEADELVREAGDERQERDPLDDQPVPRGPPEEREHEDGDDHYPQQERGAAAGMDERVALYRLGLELLARLVRVDRLVLGAVILEDAPQVGEQRDEREIRDEDRHTDEALDDHEPAAALDRQRPGDEPRRHPEERDREADRDRERED